MEPKKLTFVDRTAQSKRDVIRGLQLVPMSRGTQLAQVLITHRISFIRNSADEPLTAAH